MHSFRRDEDSIKEFFATIQNKMLYATTGKTAAELIMGRADSSKPNMGLTSFKGNRVRMVDITISKNYLQAPELEQLNELVQMFILFAEDRARNHLITRLDDWIEQMDGFLQFYGREVLRGKGHRSSKQMEAFVRDVYEKYCEICRQKELQEAENEHEAEIIALVNNHINSGTSN